MPYKFVGLFYYTLVAFIILKYLINDKIILESAVYLNVLE